MQIAVVDDLKTEIDLLSSYIIRYCKENKLSLKLATFVSGEEILAANNNHFDIIFLDTRLYHNIPLIIDDGLQFL